MKCVDSFSSLVPCPLIIILWEDLLIILKIGPVACVIKSRRYFSGDFFRGRSACQWFYIIKLNVTSLGSSVSTWTIGLDPSFTMKIRVAYFRRTHLIGARRRNWRQRSWSLVAQFLSSDEWKGGVDQQPERGEGLWLFLVAYLKGRAIDLVVHDIVNQFVWMV